jgi:hypothetical protein
MVDSTALSGWRPTRRHLRAIMVVAILTSLSAVILTNVLLPSSGQALAKHHSVPSVGKASARDSLPFSRTDASGETKAPAATAPSTNVAKGSPVVPATTGATVAPSAPAATVVTPTTTPIVPTTTPAPAPTAPTPGVAVVASLVAQVEADGIDPGPTWTWSMGDPSSLCGTIPEPGAGTGCTSGAPGEAKTVFAGLPNLALVAHEMANAETENDAVPSLLNTVTEAEAGTSWSPIDAVASCLVAHFMGFQDNAAGTWQCPSTLASFVATNIHDS